MRPLLAPVALAALASLSPSLAQSAATAHPHPPRLPYDFSEAEDLMNAELADLEGHVAVLVRQDGRPVWSFQVGDIGFDTVVHLASVTKTLSAAVSLALRDEGRFALSETLGDVFPQTFGANGIGGARIRHCFSMRHGLGLPQAYHYNTQYDLQQSVQLIGTQGTQVYPAGDWFDYHGAGMQTVARIGEVRTGEDWTELARDRVFDPCDMPSTNYQEFAPNPAVAGGGRSTAREMIRFAQMVLDEGVYGGQRVLSEASVEQLFTNESAGLPHGYCPWPSSHPHFPGGGPPDYGFGTWILAQDPTSGHVEEIVGAGAWGSYVWVDRRRGWTAVLITDVPAGSFASIDAALGLFAIARDLADANQASGLTASPSAGMARLAWHPAAGSQESRVYASPTPIRSLFDLRDATLLAVTAGDEATVPVHAHYAVTSVFGDGFENPALVPSENSLASGLAGWSRPALR